MVRKATNTAIVNISVLFVIEINVILVETFAVELNASALIFQNRSYSISGCTSNKLCKENEIHCLSVVFGMPRLPKPPTSSNLPQDLLF